MGMMGSHTDAALQVGVASKVVIVAASEFSFFGVRRQIVLNASCVVFVVDKVPGK